ncbi:MAG: sensor histidine kinase [Thermodesulfobacteriota bacterium]|nr:sensor histidine kinase [Thermodesulfobacteriota bacterium]
MSWKGDIIGETGLQFYGKTAASLSHEIKNALAIMNENAGLLDDFAAMAEAGAPIDPGRLKSLAGKVIKQIRRADGIVATMNRFAHSVDESVKDVDLREIVEFVATLSRRLASMRGVTLESGGGHSPVTITTNPFFLQNLVSLCLDFAMAAAGGGKRIGLTAEETADGARVSFAGVEGLGEVPAGTFPGEPEKNLLEALRGQMTLDAEAGELVLALSRDID